MFQMEQRTRRAPSPRWGEGDQVCESRRPLTRAFGVADASHRRSLSKDGGRRPPLLSPPGRGGASGSIGVSNCAVHGCHRFDYFVARAAATSARKASKTLAPSGTACTHSDAIGARRFFHSASCSGTSVTMLSFTRARDFCHCSWVFSPKARESCRYECLSIAALALGGSDS